MIDRALLRTTAENGTEAAGASLARSLHRFPVTIGLSGPLGSGKTAFMRGFLRALGIQGAVTSPTYALEQRYDTSRGPVVHVDLYRLSDHEARELLRASEQHPFVRCVEWPERADGLAPNIRVTLAETDREARAIDVACDDLAWPDDATIDAWRAELRLPANVGAHCDAVGEWCARAADALAERGVFARRNFVRAAGKTHDLLRFVDFKPGAAPSGHVDPPEDLAAWTEWKRRYPQPSHEEAGRAFLRDRGFPELADVVGAHSVHLPVASRTSTEAHLVYYADKRFVGTRHVTVAERYEDFGVRYGKGTRSPESLRWERDAHETEALLFPDGIPPL